MQSAYKLGTMSIAIFMATLSNAHAVENECTFGPGQVDSRSDVNHINIHDNDIPRDVCGNPVLIVQDPDSYIDYQNWFDQSNIEDSPENDFRDFAEINNSGIGLFNNGFDFRSEDLNLNDFNEFTEYLKYLTTSFPILANDTAVAVAEQHFVLGQVMRQIEWAEAGQNIISARAAVQHTGRNPTTIGARTTSLAALSLGRGISDSLTIGVTINANDARLDNNAFDMDRGFGVVIWGEYSESGAARTGLQLSGTIGYMRNEGDLARGRLLTDVVVAMGNATLDTRAVEASLGYGFEHSDWRITPSLSVAHYETTRSAYIETGADFNARYDEMRTNRTVLTLGFSGEYPVSAQGRLSLGAGVEHEVNSERLRLTGASDILGLATFDIESSFNPNRTRTFVTAGYTHYFGNGSTFSGDVRVAQATYGNTASVGLSVTYATRF